MALGLSGSNGGIGDLLSGSNGGIGDLYRAIVQEDILASIQKYERLTEQVDEQFKPIFQQAVSDLNKLYNTLDSKLLDSKLGD